MKLLHTHNAFGWLLVAACAALSCSKEEQMNLPSDQPVFYLSARVDGQNLLMEAGNEDYFMFTRLKADSNGVKEMGGLLVQDTSDLRSGFYLKFRDANALGTGGNTSVDSMLQVGAHAHHHFSQEVIDENRYEVHLSMLDSTDVQQQEWNLVLNGYSSRSSLSTVLDERDLLEWPISLQTTTSSGCMAKVTHYVDLSEPDNCQSRFTYTQNSAHSIECSVDPTAQITYVEWSDGVNLYPEAHRCIWAIWELVATRSVRPFTLWTVAAIRFAAISNWMLWDKCSTHNAKKILSSMFSRIKYPTAFRRERRNSFTSMLRAWPIPPTMPSLLVTSM